MNLTQNIIKCKKIIKFGGKKWCQLHMPNEYKLAKIIKENSRNDLDVPVTRKLYYHKLDAEKCKLLNVFYKVRSRTNISLSHLCCNGNGLVFYIHC